jgi:hypothetical protein
MRTVKIKEIRTRSEDQILVVSSKRLGAGPGLNSLINMAFADANQAQTYEGKMRERTEFLCSLI